MHDDATEGPGAIEPPAIEDLLDEITRWPAGMPVRAMEEVLALGEAAGPPVTEALVRWQDDEARDLLWLIVLTGEIGDAGSVAPLVAQMRRTGTDLASAAAEALAKIGAPACPALVEVASTGEAAERLLAYAALGGIREDSAYEALVLALGRDPELGDVVARALADQDRPEALPLMYEAYRRAEPAQRLAFEDAMWSLHHGETDAPLWAGDWRVRYRRNPEDGDWFEPDWADMAALVRESGAAAQRPVVPLRALDEILDDDAEEDGEADLCEECGTPIEEPTGVPACRETAVGVAASQIALLERARRLGHEDLFDVWDEIEEEQRALVEEGAPRKRRREEQWREDLAITEQGALTCRWLVEERIESVEQGLARLRQIAAGLAERYGDPLGLLEPPPPARAPQAKIGRNDPCPCGSGRKYKRCCLPTS